jgi:hypothetical protein
MAAVWKLNSPSIPKLQFLYDNRMVIGLVVLEGSAPTHAAMYFYVGRLNWQGNPIVAALCDAVNASKILHSQDLYVDLHLR